jgi:ribosomal protein S18 acetylase RimI-like enzyme
LSDPDISEHSMQIETATPDQLDQVAPLFNAYRVFYEQPSDLAAARAFLAERLARGDSRILLASDAGEALGFTQLYASWSSVSMRTIWILNDLFVAPGGRRRGVGRLLLRAARVFAAGTGAVRLELSTQKTNLAAQALYESEGWQREEKFFRYQLAVDP